MSATPHRIPLSTTRLKVHGATVATIWTVLFHRLLGSIVPATHEMDGVFYPVATGLPELDKLILLKADEVVMVLDRVRDHYNRYAFEKDPNVMVLAEVRIEFYDTAPAPQQTSNWFVQLLKTTLLSLLPVWEAWHLDIECFPDLSGHQLLLNVTLLQVVELMDAPLDHIPPITSTDALPFSYKIHVVDPLQKAGEWSGHG